MIKMRGFFGRNSSSLDLSIGSIEEYLRSSFEELSAPVVTACERRLAGLSRAVEEFSYALDEFSAIDLEPDEEASGINSAGFAKSQKSNYQKVLSNAVASLKEGLEDISAATGYERIYKAHGLYSSFIHKVLSTNSTFKIVVFGYHSGISLFKKPFSIIEKQVKELEYELGRDAAHFNEYNKILTSIEALRTHIEELDAIRWSEEHASTLQEGESSRILSEAKSHEHTIAELREQLRGMESKVRLHRSELEVLLKPMERAARKFDHNAKANSRITQYIAMPFDTSFTNSPYADFSEVLSKLRESIEKEASASDEKENALRHLNKAIEANIDAKLAVIRSEDKELDTIKSEIREQESKLSEYSRAASDVEEENRKRIDAAQRKEHLSSEIHIEKENIERMLGHEYGRQVRIVGL